MFMYSQEHVVCARVFSANLNLVQGFDGIICGGGISNEVPDISSFRANLQRIFKVQPPGARRDVESREWCPHHYSTIPNSQ